MNYLISSYYKLHVYDIILFTVFTMEFSTTSPPLPSSTDHNLQNTCVTAVKFLAHLVNQQVLHELVALEVLTLLLEDPTDDSVEVAVGFLKVNVHCTQTGRKGRKS